MLQEKPPRPRNNIKVDMDIYVAFGFRCYELGLITSTNRIAPMIERLMTLYVNNKLFYVLDINDRIEKDRRLIRKKDTLVDHTLKMKFAKKAYDEGYVSDPTKLANFIERLMQRFVDGDFDKFIIFKPRVND